MAANYRIRIKIGEREIEVESTDKKYVDSKIKELEAQSKTNVLESSDKRTPKKKKAKAKNEEVDSPESELDIAGLVAHIKDSENYGQVEENIIDKHAMLPKIMMCMHFKGEFSDDPYLTTGQVESITNQLDIKIGMANVANKIRDNQRYFTGKTVRRKGQAVPYKLNRQGEKAFCKYLKGEKP